MKRFDMPCMDVAEARQALEDACSVAAYNLPLFSDVMQAHSTVDTIYPVSDNTDWTDGFWPGVLWLCYEYTGGEVFRTAAQNLVGLMKERIENKQGVNHHDLGFLYSPSCVAAYKLTGDTKARDAALMAADELMGRFQPKGEFLQAWGDMGAPDNYRYIIDCLLNVPLLFWAGEETGKPEYADVARRHVATCLANSFREDGSSYHTFFMNPETGEPDHGATCQGYSDDSFWARGQAWAVYGAALAYTHTGDETLLETFDKALEFYLTRLPDDMVPYWDMLFTSGDEEPRDSSSAAIAACGLLEMAKHVNEEKAAYYRELAVQMLHSLYKGYAVRTPVPGTGLLLHGTYSKESPYNTCTPAGVDECVSWGDYFYMEALTRLAGDWVSYW